MNLPEAPPEPPRPTRRAAGAGCSGDAAGGRRGERHVPWELGGAKRGMLWKLGVAWGKAWGFKAGSDLFCFDNVSLVLLGCVCFWFCLFVFGFVWNAAFFEVFRAEHGGCPQ